jgi:glycosyltransferase involved in cell wall biosynthesis
MRLLRCRTCGEEFSERRSSGVFREVISLSCQLGLEKEIHYLGYVPDEDMSGIYAESVALVMPTFFGPTNIPPLESWAFGRPVLSSDIRGIREQIGNAGVLVDPRSVEAIAEGIFRLWTNEHLVQGVRRSRSPAATRIIPQVIFGTGSRVSLKRPERGFIRRSEGVRSHEPKWN